MAYGRRQFLRSAAAVAAATASSRLFAPALAAGFALQATPPSYPYEMLVLGDSVVWGQGLTEDLKSYSIVRDRLASELLHRSDIRMVLRVHSGSTILPQSDFFPRTYGEVPVIVPSLYAQANTAMFEYEYFYPKIKPEDVGKRVSLVLLNGGINDMGFPTLVNPLTSEQTVADKAEAFCHVEMYKLLKFLAGKFPNALLVVTGYYPIISTKTDKNTLRDLILAYLGLKKADDVMARAAKTNIRSGRSRLSDETDPVIEKLSELSSRWKVESDRCLQLAVDEINGEAVSSPGATPVCKRALFVKVEFAPEECYNAPDTALWKITGAASTTAASDNSAPRLKTDDLMFEKRQPQCLATHLDVLEQQTCEVAGTGHPNVKGAKKYADAIMEQLSRCVMPAPGD